MLLIRSQDKEILVPLNRPVYITGHEVIYCEEIESSNGSLLGNYASKDRCLEILDAIQREFQYSNHYAGSGVNSSGCQDWAYGVYQMPKK